MWDYLVLDPIVNGLVGFHKLTGSLGISIILLSALINFLLFPLDLPQLRAKLRQHQRWNQIAPELEAQTEHSRRGKVIMDLYKKHRIGPFVGLVPTAIASVLRIVILIALIQVFWQVLQPESQRVENLNESLWRSLQLSEDTAFSSQFGYLDLLSRDIFRAGRFPVPMPGLVVLSTVFLGISLAYREKVREEKYVRVNLHENVPGRLASGAKWPRHTKLYIAPLGMAIFGLIFPSGQLLYFLPTSLFMLIKSWLVPIVDD